MGYIYKPKLSKKWWIKYYKAGRCIRESSGSTDHDEAKKLLKIREGRVAEGKPLGINLEKITFDELAQDYINYYKTKELLSIKRAEQFVDHLSGFFGGSFAVEITTSMASEYIIYRQEQKKKDDQAKGRKYKPLANRTINMELKALKRMFSLGAKHSPPKVGTMPHFEMLKEAKPRSGFFEHDEFLTLRAALADHLKVALTLGYYTGLRRGTVLALRWDQIDWDNGMLRLEPGNEIKGIGRVPLLPELREVLKKWHQVTLGRYPSCPWVIHFKGQRIKRIYTGWRKATGREEVGLTGKLFHDLRRTAVRNMVRAGIPESVAMRISGHKTLSVFIRYDITSDRDIIEAGNKLSQYLQEKKAQAENGYKTVTEPAKL